MRRYSPQFTSRSYGWLLYGRGIIPPPWQWRIMAWVFLVVGFILYVLGAWLVVTGRIRVALLVAALGFILRRRVKAVAPQLAERMGTDLFLEDAEGERD